MLEPWIIEEILRREKEQREPELGRAELPVESPQYPESTTPAPSEESERGVVVIDM